MVEVVFPDGKQRSYEAGTTGLDVAKSISEGLARKVLSVTVNGEVRDLTRTLPTGTCNIVFNTWDDRDGRATYWHSSAHLLAEALESLFPNIKLGIGPAIDNGFYYDVDNGDRPITQDDFAAIEAKIKELAAKKSAYIRKDVSKADAIAYFTQKGDPYKLELLEGLDDGQITFYTQGNFTDLCRGPHIPDTSNIKAVKILNVAGAYWRGDVTRKQLTRIYAITFPKQKELDDYLTMLEEAKRRDHRKLGKELELFTFSEKVGMGLPIWLPKGALLRDLLTDFLKKVQTKAGYQPIVSPHIGGKELYVTSGHYEKYGKDSFKPIQTPEEDQEFLLKPMNCPHHCEAYKVRPRSYRELPVRYAEFGTVYRYEQSGELHGLTRVRGFTQDDAHIFCTSDQVKSEFMSVIDLVLYVFNIFGFNDFTAQISLRDKVERSKYIGDDANWEKAEKAIIEAAAEKGLKTITEYGEAAFYGPKLDFMVKDALGRSWQLGTIQVDYNLPERFELEYIGADNQKHRPVMIHRAPFGSLERFISILIENTAGNFDMWLSPTQIAVLPIADKFNDYAEKVAKQLEAANYRVTFDDRAEKIGRKIRDAETNKIPFMAIIGEKEAETNSIALRQHGKGDLGVFTLADAMAKFAIWSVPGAEY